MDKKYTFCRICEPCCGFVAELENGIIVRYYADREHPISKGYSCVKGRQMPGIQHHPKRIKFPLKRRNGEFERISWEQAIEEIGSKLVELKDNYGPHSIGAYIGNVLAFSYSAVLYCGAFMKFLGTRNMYGAGSQDCNNKFAHSLRFYGSPLTIVSPDFDAVDCLLAFGTNPLAAHFTFANFPNPLARLKEMEKRGCKIAWINPRRIEAAEAAGEHYFIRPNTDHYLVFGMINYVLENGLEDKEFIRTYSKGIDRLRGVAREFGSDLDRIEGITGVPKEHVIRLTNDFLEASKKGGAAAYGRLGTDRGPFGTLSAWAIDTLNFITGNIDKRGNYYSPGFLNIAASSQMESVASGEQPKSRIGGFSSVMGNLPAATMADEILTPGEGQIKAMIVLAGDPLVSCPNTRKLEKAFRDLELLVSVDIFMNDTGPDAIPFVLLTISPLGLSFENENPVPPPDCWIIAISFNVRKILSRESSTGRTKHADNCPRFVPAFINVGELGRNSRFFIISKNLLSQYFLFFFSADAIAFETLLKSSVGVSIIFPFSSFKRYLSCSTLIAFTSNFKSSFIPKNFLSSLACALDLR